MKILFNCFCWFIVGIMVGMFGNLMCLVKNEFIV